MPAVLALPAFWGAVSGVGAGVGAIGAAKLSGNASRDAANLQVQASDSAVSAQTAAANRALDAQTQSAANTLAFQKQQAAQDQSNFQNTQLANYGQYANRQQNIGYLGQLLGLPARNIPPPPAYLTSPQSGSPATASGSSAGAVSGSDPAAYTLSLIQGGMAPQQAASATNKKFGLTTGSEAVYYANNNTIGLPNAYLAGPTGKSDSPAAWNIVPRSPEPARGAYSAQAANPYASTLGGMVTTSPVLRTAPLQMPGVS